jgi:hypothetical protein
MRNKKATGDDDVPGDVFKLFGGGLKIMTKLISTIYETGEWLKDFTEVTMDALQKKPQDTNCSVHKITTKLINTIFETGEWPKDFTEVTMITLKKKPQATECSDDRKSVLSHIQRRQ